MVMKTPGFDAKRELYNFMGTLKITELYTSKWWFPYLVNYILIKKDRLSEKIFSTCQRAINISSMFKSVRTSSKDNSKEYQKKENAPKILKQKFMWKYLIYTKTKSLPYHL